MTKILTVREWIYMKSYIKSCRANIGKVNAETGEISIRYDPMDISEDYFLGTRGEPSEIPISFKLK
jgi:hypothetical protein